MLNVPQALEIIENNRTVAVVGLSPKEDRPSFRVAKYLLDHGFAIIPVTPGHKEILGQPCFKNLSELEPGQADWIDMFIHPKRLPDFQEEIIRLSPKLVWCQIGVVNNEFNREIEKNNIPLIADVCPKLELEKRD